MEKLAIGRVYTNQYGETEIDDYRWSPEMDEVEEGYQLIFGKINVFVGMVSATGDHANESESVSEARTIVESDGEESVGTSQVGIVAEEKESEMLLESVSEPDYDADSESILPLFEDRLGYGIEEECMQSPIRSRHIGVYMSGSEHGADNAGGNQFDPNLLTKEITAENVAARAEELLAAREAIERQLAEVAEANRKLAAKGRKLTV